MFASSIPMKQYQQVRCVVVLFFFFFFFFVSSYSRLLLLFIRVLVYYILTRGLFTQFSKQHPTTSSLFALPSSFFSTSHNSSSYYSVFSFYRSERLRSMYICINTYTYIYIYTCIRAYAFISFLMYKLQGIEIDFKVRGNFQSLCIQYFYKLNQQSI
jgi:hypothetical protein